MFILFCRRVNGYYRVGVFSLRNIFSGEELTVDYGSAKHLSLSAVPQKCCCDSQKCSYFIPAIFATPDLTIVEANKKVSTKEADASLKKSKKRKIEKVGFFNLETELPTSQKSNLIPYSKSAFDTKYQLFLRRNVRASAEVNRKKSSLSNSLQFSKQLTPCKFFILKNMICTILFLLF